MGDAQIPEWVLEDDMRELMTTLVRPARRKLEPRYQSGKYNDQQ